MAEYLLQANDLVCCRGRVKVLDAGDITINKRDQILLTGQNGSGKSTLLEVISRRVSCAVASYSQALNLYPELSAAENIEFFTGINSAGFASETLTDLQQKFALGDLGRKPVSELSTGQQHKLALVLTLAQKADLYLLDEPLSNLDQQSCRTFIDWLTRDASASATFIIASHQIADLGDWSGQQWRIENTKVLKSAARNA